MRGKLDYPPARKGDSTDDRSWRGEQLRSARQVCSKLTYEGDGGWTQRLLSVWYVPSLLLPVHNLTSLVRIGKVKAAVIAYSDQLADRGCRS